MRSHPNGLRAAVILSALALGCTTTNPDLKAGLGADDAGGGRDARRPGPASDADLPPAGGAPGDDAGPVGGRDARDAQSGGADPSDAKPNTGGAPADAAQDECTPGATSTEA